MSEKVLITGGSGLIGTRLTALLLQKGYHVSHLGRAPAGGGVPAFVWNPDSGVMDDNALNDVAAVIHLAGASIAGKRWSANYKKEILNSRVRSTRLLSQKLTANPGVRTFISASGIGFYGQGAANAAFTEGDQSGDDFLASVVREWEREVEKIGSVVPSVSMVRTGIVLSSAGGALSEMARPIRFGLGAPLGTGEQIVSWVHIDDLCRAYIFLLERGLSGPFNVTAPHPVSNRMLTEAIAKKLGKPLWLPNIPPLVLKIILGEVSTAVLTGSAASSAKIVEKGFGFEFANLPRALEDLLK